MQKRVAKVTAKTGANPPSPKGYGGTSPPAPGYGGTRIGYVRVSTEDQNPMLQIEALKAAGCEKIFQDQASGHRTKFQQRRGLKAALKELREGDELVVWKLDRLGRSMIETVSIILELDKRGVGFRSLTESFDVKTPIGRGVLAFMAAVAEDELERIRERTRAGIEVARRRGVRLGRPRKLSEQQLDHAARMIEGKHESIAGMARLMSVDRSTLHRRLRTIELQQVKR